MAREHARMKVSIWNDPDYRALTAPAQHAYQLATSYPDLSYCGVMDYLPGRLAAFAAGQTVAKVTAAFRELSRTRFVIIDTGTSELLVRTYARHDGVLDRLNMGKAMTRAYAKVASMPLREAFEVELGRLYRENPDLAGWRGVETIDPALYQRVQKAPLKAVS